ncbi:MAG: Rpn family recombination-promoting nuclease/putative transposase [Deltaproteobacteria bacterium]|nr:Rpn family recombination-promoting nuclease/putative transposase [Deltaproteobacteria bacterium]
MDNDGSYKRIFSEPRMVQDLLKGYIHQDWVKEADFSTLARVKSDHISDNWDQRFNDTVWKVKLRDSWIYVCIMLEFQSRPDRFMPLRMMTYLGLLYEDIVRSGQLLQTGRLPPVLPVVLYNGTPRLAALCGNI